MDNEPLVSVGLPTYNRAADLSRAIASVLAQDYTNLELILSDNASPDDTQEVCEEFRSRDGRLTYLRQPINRGARPNFLEVLAHSQGEFFMWMGDDDWLDRSYISECIRKLIDHPDYSLV